MTTLELLRESLELIAGLEDNLCQIERDSGFKVMLDHARNIRQGLESRLGLVEAMYKKEYSPAEPRCAGCGEELYGETEAARGTCADCNEGS